MEESEPREEPCEAEWLMGLAKGVSVLSDDTVTRTGAVISANGKIVSQAANGLPKGCCLKRDEVELAGRYVYIEHAERRAIFRMVRDGLAMPKGAVMATTRFPCLDCARAIADTGIGTLITPPPEADSKWAASQGFALDVLRSCDVEVIFWEADRWRRVKRALAAGATK